MGCIAFAQKLTDKEQPAGLVDLTKPNYRRPYDEKALAEGHTDHFSFYDCER